MEETKLKPRICTFTGVEFWPFEPKHSMIRIADIAHHLAAICRFTGATSRPYSVAQHSVLVSWAVSKAGGTEEAQLAALLHDAAEAYMLDIPSPLKSSYGDYKTKEKVLLKVIFERFGLDWPMPISVKVADELLVLAERRDMLPHTDWWEAKDGTKALLPSYNDHALIQPWDFDGSKQTFLQRFEQLYQ